jgi:hypothetical protein
MASKFRVPKSIFNLDKLVKAGLKQGLQRSSIEIAGIPNTTSGGVIKNEMNKPKTGTIYPIIVVRKRRYINHQASNRSGNESSAILGGKLASSVRGRTLGTNRLEISANTPYASIQEKGGRNGEGAYIAPRNNLIRPIKQSRGNIINNIKQGINALTK